MPLSCSFIRLEMRAYLISMLLLALSRWHELGICTRSEGKVTHSAALDIFLIKHLLR